MTRAIVFLSIPVLALGLVLFSRIEPEVEVHSGPAPSRDLAEATRTLPPTTVARSKATPIEQDKRARAWTWDQLAQCESGGRWDLDAFHDGGLQFAVQTWASYAPEGFPAYAFQATREQQIVVAERVLADQGIGAWPTCSYRIGAR